MDPAFTSGPSDPQIESHSSCFPLLTVRGPLLLSGIFPTPIYSRKDVRNGLIAECLGQRSLIRRVREHQSDGMDMSLGKFFSFFLLWNFNGAGISLDSKTDHTTGIGCSSLNSSPTTEPSPPMAFPWASSSYGSLVISPTYVVRWTGPLCSILFTPPAWVLLHGGPQAICCLVASNGMHAL